MTPKSPCVFIILVNWNGLSDTRECLESLSKITYPNARVVVVDNGSQNGDANNLRL
jgi:GT2 family glycosyltransferase